MVTRPYFMSDETWYTKNQEGELVLTDKAPADAVSDYNKHKNEYIKKVKDLSNEEYLDYLMTEDNDWFVFPIN